MTVQKKCTRCKQISTVHPGVKQCRRQVPPPPGRGRGRGGAWECRGFLQSPMLVDLVDNPTAVRGSDPEEVAHWLDDEELIDYNEVFAILEINGHTELIYFNVNNRHAEENLADDLTALFQSLHVRGEDCNFQAIRIIIRFSPCLPLCTPKFLTAKRVADGYGYNMTWIIDFANIYVGHESSLDLLIDAGFVIPNYLVVQALTEVRSSIVELKRKLQTVGVLVRGNVIDAGTQHLLVLAKEYFLKSRSTLHEASELILEAEGMCLGYHFNIYQYNLMQIEQALRPMVQAFTQVGQAGGMDALQQWGQQALQAVDRMLAMVNSPRPQLHF